MGVELASKNDRRRLPVSPRQSSARLVAGRDISAALLLGQRDVGRVGVFALADLPSIEKRRRYLAALDRIVTRIRQT